MKEIKPINVSFEQAKVLKEKGFDIWVQKHYDGYVPDELRCSNGFKMPKYCPQIPKFDYMSLNMVYYAPEQWQVVEWLRVNHGIWIVVNIAIDDKWYFELYNLKDKRNAEIIIGDENITDYHNSPQEAYSAAFDYILNNLI